MENVFQKHKYVYAVYKEKSFTKAAQKLFIAQPSLSAAIKNLEKEIGAPIFDRSGAEIVLTEIGREYIEATEKILKIEEEFSRKLGDIYGLETGKITVGGTNYLSSYVLPNIINRFSALYPKVEVSIVEANSTHLRELLEREEIDIIVDSFDDTMSVYEGYPLTSERIFLCVPKDRAINDTLKEFRMRPRDVCKGKAGVLKTPCVPLEKFRDEKFVLLKSGNDMYYRAMRLFEKTGVQPNVSFSVDQLNISRALAESGMGCAFLTDTFFRFWQGEERLFLYNVAGGDMRRTLYVAHKKNRYRTSAMAKFMLTAKEIFEK